MTEMKKTSLLIACVVLGSIIGYFIGIASRCPIQILILVVINGAFFGYFLGLALFWKKYGTLLWSVVATFIALIVDWVAGSPRVSMLDKLAFAFAGLFIGFDFWAFRKQILIAGCIGGLLGFVWGMNDNAWFGYARLEPGLLNAILSSIKGFIFGMLFGSFYMQVFGSRHVIIDSES